MISYIFLRGSQEKLQTKLNIHNLLNTTSLLFYKRYVCVVEEGKGRGSNPAKCQACLTQQSAETWETGFHLLGQSLLLTVRGHRSKRGQRRGRKMGLTFSWSWTLAPFFSRVSTTLEWPYWEATVRAVPPSCLKKNKPAVRQDSC